MQPRTAKTVELCAKPSSLVRRDRMLIIWSLWCPHAYLSWTSRCAQRRSCWPMLNHCSGCDSFKDSEWHWDNSMQEKGTDPEVHGKGSQSIVDLWVGRKQKAWLDSIFGNLQSIECIQVSLKPIRTQIRNGSCICPRFWTWVPYTRNFRSPFIGGKFASEPKKHEKPKHTVQKVNPRRVRKQNGADQKPNQERFRNQNVQTLEPQ